MRREVHDDNPLNPTGVEHPDASILEATVFDVRPMGRAVHPPVDRCLLGVVRCTRRGIGDLAPEGFRAVASVIDARTRAGTVGPRVDVVEWRRTRGAEVARMISNVDGVALRGNAKLGDLASPRG